MKVKITENTKQASLAVAEEVRKLHQFGFWEERTDKEWGIMSWWGEAMRMSWTYPLVSTQRLVYYPMYKNNLLVTYRSILWLPYACIESFSRNIQRNRCFYLWRWLPESHEGGFIQCPHLRYSQREPLGQCSQPRLHNIITWRALRKFWCPDYSQDQWRQTLVVEDLH